MRSRLGGHERCESEENAVTDGRLNTAPGLPRQCGSSAFGAAGRTWGTHGSQRPLPPRVASEKDSLARSRQFNSTRPLPARPAGVCRSSVTSSNNGISFPDSSRDRTSPQGSPQSNLAPSTTHAATRSPPVIRVIRHTSECTNDLWVAVKRTSCFGLLSTQTQHVDGPVAIERQNMPPVGAPKHALHDAL